jgi:hypothetical protein
MLDEGSFDVGAVRLNGVDMHKPSSPKLESKSLSGLEKVEL